MMRSFIPALLAACIASCATAGDSCTTGACPSSCGELQSSSQPPWTGTLCCRSAVTGDWWGTRSALADSGITFSGNATQFYAGVTNGGRTIGGQTGNWQYSGHNDYILDIDMGRAIGLKGNMLKIRAEHRYGETIDGQTGAILPATLAGNLPVVDSEKIYVTNFLFTQFLSETSAVYFGKLDTLDGDLNAFAHGRGKSQFLNTSLVTNPALLRIVPYSTLGAGALFILSPESIVNIGVLNATDTAGTTGFSELFNEGAVVTAEGRFETELFGRPGHQLFGGAWSSREFTSLQQDPRIIFPPAGIPIARRNGSWAAYYNFDQYIGNDPCNPERGWGVFGRFGITDGNPNPIDWFLSFGIGGSSMIGGRDSDTWGVGWYMNSTSDQLGPVASAFLGADDGQGAEFFYNYAVTPWFHLTSDVQYIRPGARNRADDAVVVALRARIDL